MTALVFVDTNVLLYTHDERDLGKQARARDWVQWCWRERAGRISSQVLNEFYNNAITKFRKAVTAPQVRVQRLNQLVNCFTCSKQVFSSYHDYSDTILYSELGNSF